MNQRASLQSAARQPGQRRERRAGRLIICGYRSLAARSLKLLGLDLLDLYLLHRPYGDVR
ncbi:MAG TPA: hypothetical protein VHM25_20455 [Polyangiaceae bacterium]|nr:hypothetical protein [Polyangiaceae bacterium]